MNIELMTLSMRIERLEKILTGEGIDILSLFQGENEDEGESMKEQLNKLKESYAELSQVIDGAPKEKKPSAEGEHTIAQRLLAIHYLQKFGQFPNSPDKKPIADFITFLIAGNKKNIYDKLRNMHSYIENKNDKTIRINLQIVKNQFVRIKRLDIVEAIENDLRKLG